MKGVVKDYRNAIYDSTHLQIVSIHKDWHSQSNTAQPLEEHLCEALCVFLGQRIEEVSPQEIEQHATQARRRVSLWR